MSSRATLVNKIVQIRNIKDIIPFATVSLTRVATKPPTTCILQGGNSVRGYTVATKPNTTHVNKGGDSVRGYTVATKRITTHVSQGGDSVRGYTFTREPFTTHVEGGDSVRGYGTLSIPKTNSSLSSSKSVSSNSAAQ